jgi:hypothetical protein
MRICQVATEQVFQPDENTGKRDKDLKKEVREISLHILIEYLLFIGNWHIWYKEQNNEK